jgi:hypothetical protein
MECFAGSGSALKTCDFLQPGISLAEDFLLTPFSSQPGLFCGFALSGRHVASLGIHVTGSAHQSVFTETRVQT